MSSFWCRPALSNTSCKYYFERHITEVLMRYLTIDDGPSEHTDEIRVLDVLTKEQLEIELGENALGSSKPPRPFWNRCALG